MVSYRASRVLGFSALASVLVGCSMMHHGAQSDAGPSDAAVVAVAVDAGPPPPSTPENVNTVGRYPDEVSLNDNAAKIADPNVSARSGVPGGALVATLRLGTPVTQVAKHEGFILCIFPDPKNAARNLEGWVAEQAFVPGASAPSKSLCPHGQVRLTFDEQDFCGKVCKADADCKGGQTCSGKANLLVPAKGAGDAGAQVGAEVATCTLPPGAAATDGGDGSAHADGGAPVEHGPHPHP